MILATIMLLAFVGFASWALTTKARRERAKTKERCEATAQQAAQRLNKEKMVVQAQALVDAFLKGEELNAAFVDLVYLDGSVEIIGPILAHGEVDERSRYHAGAIRFTALQRARSIVSNATQTGYIRHQKFAVPTTALKHFAYREVRLQKDVDKA